MKDKTNVSLSIIIVNYKSWSVLRKCINSFSEFPPTMNYEIIIVDNDSQDGQLDMFNVEFPEIKFLKNSGNHGFSNGCNFGASKAKGQYLLFLNPDIIVKDSQSINEMFNYAVNNPDTGITSCRRISEKGKIEREISILNLWLISGWMRALYKLRFYKALSIKYPINAKLYHPDWVSGSVVLIKTDLFNKVGGWSQDDFWMYSEDPDLCLKVRNQGKEITLLRYVELLHSHGGSSRRNYETIAITKSEVVTSHHVFIDKHSRGIKRIVLHIFTLCNTLASWTLRTIISLLVFWKPLFKASLFTLFAIFKYYISALFRWTWKSKRLEIKT